MGQLCQALWIRRLIASGSGQNAVACFDEIGHSLHAHERASTGISWYSGCSHSAGSQHTLWPRRRPESEGYGMRYDTIIVGGGPARGILAGPLAEDPHRNV